MKLVVIGLGQCGGRVADQFARVNHRARRERGIEITPGVFAVNTDTADLSGLMAIKPDYKHRILIGGGRTAGHGVGKINELAADIAKGDSDKVVDAIRSVTEFYESDAFLLVAAAAGGTGSGSIPIMTKIMKERYEDKPVYNLIVLPFGHEESTEERTIYNTAVCLKSVSSVADAVILVDNQRYVKKDLTLRNNLSEINSFMVEPFYDLLCAGEERKPRRIGAKTLDAGDIIQTLTGWTVIGYGTSRVRALSGSSDFRSKNAQSRKGKQAMAEAISELSVSCEPRDAGKALYLLSAPDKEMIMDLVKELGQYLRSIAPNATIRNGDYPGKKRTVDVHVVLSQLNNVERVREYYAKSSSLIPVFEKRREETESRLRDMQEVGKDVPSLL